MRAQAVVTAASLSLFLSVRLSVCLSVCLSVRTRVRMQVRCPEDVAAQRKSGEIEAPEAESKELRASA